MPAQLLVCSLGEEGELVTCRVGHDLPLEPAVETVAHEGTSPASPNLPDTRSGAQDAGDGPMRSHLLPATSTKTATRP